MKANLTTKEPEILRNWDEIGLFERIKKFKKR